MAVERAILIELQQIKNDSVKFRSGELKNFHKEVKNQLNSIEYTTQITLSDSINKINGNLSRLNTQLISSMGNLGSLITRLNTTVTNNNNTSYTRESSTITTNTNFQTSVRSKLNSIIDILYKQYKLDEENQKEKAFETNELLEALQNSREQTENTRERIKEKDSGSLGALLKLGTALAAAVSGALVMFSPFITEEIIKLIKQKLKDMGIEPPPIPKKEDIDEFRKFGTNEKVQGAIGAGWDLTSNMLRKSADFIEDLPGGTWFAPNVIASFAARTSAKVTDAFSEAIKDPLVVKKFRDELAEKNALGRLAEVFTPRGVALAYMDMASMLIPTKDTVGDENIIKMEARLRTQRALQEGKGYKEDIYDLIDRLTPPEGLSSTPEKEYRYESGELDVDSQYINEQLSKDLLLEEPPASGSQPKPQTKAKPKPEKGQWITSGEDGKPIVLIPGKRVDGMDIPPVVVPASATKNADLNFLNEQLGQMVGQLKSSEESQLRSEQTLNEINKNLQESNRGSGTIYNNNTYVEGARPTLSELTRD